MQQSSHSNQEFKRGQIYYINGDSNNKPVGAEIWPDRMGLIVSSNANNLSSDVVEVVYLTTSTNKRVGPTHIQIESKGRTALALCEQIHSVDKSRLGDYMNNITDDEQQGINTALQFSLQLTPANNHTIINVFKKLEHYVNKYNVSINGETINNISQNQPNDELVKQLMLERDSYRNLYEAKVRDLDRIKGIIA